ncbi:MAG: response regulator, partial [Proteobacteria bacterium]
MDLVCSLLVVENDRSIREALSEVFIYEGYNTETVSNVDAAIQWLSKNS